MAQPLTDTLSGLQRRFGPDALRRGEGALQAGVWPSGLPVLDGGVLPGGLPLGRVSVLTGMGPAASGRLTLLQALAARASRSMRVAYLDLNGSLDPGFLADLGADLDAMLVLRPRRGELGAGLAMARAVLNAGVPWLGIAFGPGLGRVDSWSHALTATVEAAHRGRAVVCVSAPAPLAAPLAYASSLTVQCHGAGWQEAHGDIVGLRVRLTTVKSKLGAPGTDVRVLLRYPRPQAQAEVLGLPAVVGVQQFPAEPLAPPVAGLAG
ncbi:MAG: hypothetical protein ABR541_03435 [Candidatus Dormibacteria bacterium]